MTQKCETCGVNYEYIGNRLAKCPCCGHECLVVLIDNEKDSHESLASSPQKDKGEVK